MKIAYFGIDLLCSCLELLIERKEEIACIFTTRSDNYDTTDMVMALAQKHNISIKTSKVTKQDIAELEAMGVELSVTAGYPYLIPVSEKIRQVNVHPAYLPIGRGAWPMPVSILKGVSSGVTLHKLSDRFDEGDIILRKEIPLSDNENLETLTEKIFIMSPIVLNEFLENLEYLWQNAAFQEEGEYWEEPSDDDRTVTAELTVKKATDICRAFYGYGVLYKSENETVELRRAEAFEECEAHLIGDKKAYPISGGFIISV